MIQIIQRKLAIHFENIIQIIQRKLAIHFENIIHRKLESHLLLLGALLSTLHFCSLDQLLRNIFLRVGRSPGPDYKHEKPEKFQKVAKDRKCDLIIWSKRFFFENALSKIPVTFIAEFKFITYQTGHLTTIQLGFWRPKP